MSRFQVSLPLAALVVALASGAAPRPSSAQPALEAKGAPAAILGISARNPNGTLGWFNPLTLEPLRGRKAPLAGHGGSWAFSADRSRIALAGECGGGGGAASIRFVNARTMRVLGDLRLSPYYWDCAGLLTWLRPNRLLAVLSSANSTQVESSVVVIDPTTRRVLRRVSLPDAQVYGTGATRDQLVLLFGGVDGFAPARVAVVDADGNVRSTVVDRVLVGTAVDSSSQTYRARTISPGFAVDPEGRRAFLVPANGDIAEIDLRSRTFSFHTLDHPSLLRRFLDWLTPAAEAKEMEGAVREARWLGDGLLAVSGLDYALANHGTESEHMVATPAGVKLVDTRAWRAQMLSSGSSSFAVGQGLVVAQGGAWEDEKPLASGPGLVAFGSDGRERWQLHPNSRVGIDISGSLGYVWLSQGHMEVVDLATGEILRTLVRNERANPWPRLLAAPSSGW
jgi:hypothetical protein